MDSTLQNVNLLDKWFASSDLFPFAFINTGIDAVNQTLAKTILPTADSNLISIKAEEGWGDCSHAELHFSASF